MTKKRKVMKKDRYESPSAVVNHFTAECSILDYSGLNDMTTPPGSGWTEPLDNDFLGII